MMNANKLGLWCAAYGIDAPTTAKINGEPRIKWELQEHPVDAKGLLDTVKSLVVRLGCQEAQAELNTPMGQLRFMELVEQANA